MVCSKLIKIVTIGVGVKKWTSDENCNTSVKIWSWRASKNDRMLGKFPWIQQLTFTLATQSEDRPAFTNQMQNVTQSPRSQQFLGRKWWGTPPPTLKGLSGLQCHSGLSFSSPFLIDQGCFCLAWHLIHSGNWISLTWFSFGRCQLSSS